jgi:DNA-binding protein H-NS
MENKSIEELEQELADFEAEATRLKSVIAEAKQARHLEDIAQVHQLMLKLNVSLADLQAVETQQAVSKTRGTGKIVPPKYKDPATDTTWSGRGAAPKWLKAYEADGRNRDEFLIDRK